MNKIKVETVVDAMDVCKKEHKKFKKIVMKNEAKTINNKDFKDLENLPLWFDKKVEKNEESLEELNEVLKDFD